ncbi:MAG: Ig domain-containing protein [Butyrivibrio sp.]|nr:Ig domain-containing protein [Butyrivibrio sp.]
MALSFMFSLILFKLPAEAAEPTVINLSDLEEGQALELQEDTILNLNETSITLKRYEFFQLFANVTPDSATNQNIVWSSSNKDAVFVNRNGQVFAIQSGTAVITAKTEDGNYEASCEVTVPEGDDGRNLGLKINMCDRHDKEDTPYISISYNGSPIYEQRDYVLRFGSNEENGLSNVAILGMDDYLWIYTDPTTEYDYPASEYSEERLNRTLGLKIELNSYDGEEAPILKIIYDGSTLNEGTDYFVDYSTNTEDDSSCFVIKGLDDFIWNDNH